jgi:hypothetical protein
LVMLASLYYEPLWIFYSGADTLTRINELHDRRIAVGIEGSDTRALAEPLLAANGLTGDNAALVPMSKSVALRALQSGEIQAAILLGGVQSPAVWEALHDPNLKLMSLSRADAYPRRFSYLSRLTLPPGTIDFALNLPAQEVNLIGTKAMLVARDGRHPALINLRTDAAHEIHRSPGLFELAGELPETAPVDLRVSTDADQHKRFGPGFLYRYMPFWVGAFVERAIVVLLPLAVVLVPLARPALLWRTGAARARCRDAQGRIADREVARRPRPDRARRGAHRHAGKVRERGAYAARAHRAGAPVRSGQTQRAGSGAPRNCADRLTGAADDGLARSSARDAARRQEPGIDHRNLIPRKARQSIAS